MLTNQITSMIAVFGLSQILRRFDLTTPEAILYIRILYYTSQALQLLSWFYVRYLIQKKGKKEERTTMIEIIEPAKPFSGEPPKKTRVSIYDYDLAEVQKNLNQVFSGLAIMTVLHFWLKFTQPLIFQSILPWKNFFTMPVVQIRIFGWKAEGNLARPFKVPNPFADLMGQATGAAAGDDDSVDSKSKSEESFKSKIELVKDSSSEEEKEENVEVDSSVSSSSNLKSKGSGVKSRKPRKE